MPYLCETACIDGGFDALDYAYSHHGIARGITVVQSEIDLWCAVIYQAFVDVGVATPNVPHLIQSSRGSGTDYNTALYWLLYDTRDFPFICELAGVSPDVIRRVAVGLLAF